MDNDTQLLRRYVRQRDETAFATLVRRRLGLVYSVALRRVGGDSHLAEDVAQKVFIDLARKAASLSGRTTLTGWLYVSTHHASAAVARSECRRKIRESENQAMPTTLPESTPEPDLNRLRLTLDEVIVALRDDEREAIALRFFESRSFAEIGTALRLSEEAARKRLDRALDKLRVALSRRGLTSTSLALTATLGELGASVVPAGLAAQIAGGALMQGTGWTLASLLNPAAVIGSAALLVGGLAVLKQENINQRFETELAGFSPQAHVIDRLRNENSQLAQAAAAADDQRLALVEPQAVVPAQPNPTPPPSVTQTSTITVTPAGTLQWGSETITLDSFLSRLEGLQKTGPDRNATLVIRSQGNFPQMAYVIDEARKAGITHVRVDSGTSADATFKPGWF